MDTFVKISGLLFGCPLKKTNKKCPLYEIRKRPFLERYNFLKNLGIREIKQIESKHNMCYDRIVNK